jgi:hypothetical protein
MHNFNNKKKLVWKWGGKSCQVGIMRSLICVKDFWMGRIPTSFPRIMPQTQLKSCKILWVFFCTKQKHTDLRLCSNHATCVHSFHSYSILSAPEGSCSASNHPRIPPGWRMPTGAICSSVQSIWHCSSLFSVCVESVGHRRNTMIEAGKGRPFPSGQTHFPMKDWNLNKHFEHKNGLFFGLTSILAIEVI